jgi:PAS domain S-box-containing protein
MLEEIINDPAIEKYKITFRKGEILCMEGDASKDLYILVSGKVEILKGQQRITEIAERGSSIGEISFLLGTKRTATIKARYDGTALRIPEDKVNQFLQEFPVLGWQIPRLLAQRLEEGNRAYVVLKEFCDQLPDAVVATEEDGKIIAWNKAAERMFGVPWDQMKNRALAEIYQNPDDYRQILDELRSSRAIKEKILTIRHPEKGVRHISTSTSVLYDGDSNFAGILNLSRDVTAMQTVQKKYRRIRVWMASLCLGIGILASALYFVYPHFSVQRQIISAKQQTLQNRLADDCLLLTSLLTDSLARRDRDGIMRLMKEFYRTQNRSSAPISGIILLDENRSVFWAYSLVNDRRLKGIEGSSYSDISFQSCKDSVHKVLSLYRTGKSYPRGRKGVEIAFEMKRGDRFLGWLLFQLNMTVLKSRFEVDEKTLKIFKFDRTATF